MIVWKLWNVELLLMILRFGTIFITNKSLSDDVPNPIIISNLCRWFLVHNRSLCENVRRDALEKIIWRFHFRWFCKTPKCQNNIFELLNFICFDPIDYDSASCQSCRWKSKDLKRSCAQSCTKLICFAVSHAIYQFMLLQVLLQWKSFELNFHDFTS